MANVLKTIWNGLSAVYATPAMEALSSLSPRFHKSTEGDLVYKSASAYRSVIDYWLRREAMQAVERTVNAMFPTIQRNIERKLREPALKQQDWNRIALIEQGRAIDDGLGTIRVQGGHTYTSMDKYGNKVQDSLILYYTGDEPIIVTRTKLRYDGHPENQIIDTYITNTVFFDDLAPHVNLDSQKNLIMTQVQGRDYSRKELVSGGDLKFSVSGNIVYDEPGIYPENDVKKFIQIMQYGGVINVNHRLFKMNNVKAIIIDDWHLGDQEFKNMQPYSFTCVAVEPDEDVLIKKDTINHINYAISESPMNKWYSLILNSKLSSSDAGIITDSIATLIDLIPHI